MGERHEFTIEVINGAFTAASWMRGYRDAIITAAISSGAVEWRWHEFSWGVCFDVAFRSEPAWERFRELPGVRAALDAVPDGVVVKRGWGGTSGTWEPRRPGPVLGSGAADLPLPAEDVPRVTAVAGRPA